MKYMQCTSCKSTVEANDICICLQCQGNHPFPQKDVWKKKPVTLLDVIEADIPGETNYDRLMRYPKLEDED